LVGAGAVLLLMLGVTSASTPASGPDHSLGVGPAPRTVSNALVLGPSTSDQARALCGKRLSAYAAGGNPQHVRLVATFPTTAGVLAAADEARHGSGYQSPFAYQPASAAVAVCFFDADAFGIDLTPTGPPHGFNRLEEVVSNDGTARLFQAGYQDRLTVEPPAPSGTGS